MPPCPAGEKHLAMEFGAPENRAEKPRQPVGEGGGFFFGGDEILAGLDEEAREPAACDFLVQRIALERAIIGFVVADQKPVLG
jgi:hypothetical protein